MIQRVKEPDLRSWLKDPCTQFFFQWLIKNHNELKDAGLDSCYNNFASEDPKIKQAITRDLGRANGLALVIVALEELFSEVQENEERAAEQSAIKTMLNIVYGGKDENN
jgi:hypothetical protein